MKKMLKVIGMILLVIIALVVLLFVKAALTPSAPDNYTETVKTGGDIESTYLKNGQYSVSYFEKETDEDFKKFEVWYPEEMKNENKTYPLIVVLNGTGVKASRYKSQFKHFASWGFIVIGTEEEESWDAVAADQSLSFMLEENENPEGNFYHKIDTENIAAIGHSQGGAGVFNAVTAFENSSYYKTAVPLSPTNEKLSADLGWHYDLSKLNIPVLLLAGTVGDFEMQTVIPEEDMKRMYDRIPSQKVMARKLECEHGHMLYSADGYVTAWLMWHLRNDQKAASAFTGDAPELLSNPLYRAQKIDLDPEN